MKRSLLSLVLVILFFSLKSWAIDPFEIEVYDADLKKPGETGIELHANYVADGRKNPDFTGEVPPNGLMHFTLEPGIGITRFWEAHAYIMMGMGPLSGGGQTYFGGAKIASKFAVPEDIAGHYLLGFNLELGKNSASFEEGGAWSTEIRPILGVESGRWLVALNPIFEWSLGMGGGTIPSFEPAWKIRYNTGMGFGIGPEYYSTLGPLNQIPGIKNQEHVLYLAGDLMNHGNFELNFGIGHGLTEASNNWTTKLIIGKEF